MTDTPKDDPKLGRCANCIAPEGRRCPHWIGAEDGIMEMNEMTKQSRVFVGCSCGAFQARMARYIIGTLDHYTHEISAGRSELAETLGRLAKQVELSRKSVLKSLEDATRNASRTAVLEQFADAIIARRIQGPNDA